jgi:hypothetical protein
MSPATLRRLTWSRVGVALSVGLIAFGAVVALLPHHHDTEPPPMSLPRGTAGDRVTNVGAQELAAQRVAEQFVIACDTTDPAHPDGDMATETALAPGLGVPHDVVGPAAWRTEDRRTTVTLDPPGPPVAEPGDTVAVIVTGIMTVTSDSSTPVAVPVAERIALHPLPDDHSSDGGGASGWRVVDVEVGA